MRRRLSPWVPLALIFVATAALCHHASADLAGHINHRAHATHDPVENLPVGGMKFGMNNTIVPDAGLYLPSDPLQIDEDGDTVNYWVSNPGSLPPDYHFGGTADGQLKFTIQGDPGTTRRIVLVTEARVLAVTGEDDYGTSSLATATLTYADISPSVGAVATYPDDPDAEDSGWIRNIKTTTVEFDSSGNAEVTYPFTIYISGAVLSDENAEQSAADIYASATVRLSQVYAVQPNPLGDPDPVSTTAPVSNEYVVYGDTGPFQAFPDPFKITSWIGTTSTDWDTIEWLKSQTNRNWALSREFPNRLPMLDDSHDYSTIWPNYFVTIPGYNGDHGLAYDLNNGLPADVSAFGRRNMLFPTLLGDTPPIEIFFAATLATHPWGGPPSLIGGTPNYVYYYDQVWKNPWGYNFTYAPIYEASLTNGSIGTILLGTQSHGSSVAGWGTFLFMIKDGEILEQTGEELPRGIDFYARVLMHECVHMRCYQLIHDLGYVDVDGDGVPDLKEAEVGLDPALQASASVADFEASLSQGNHDDSEVFARMYERDVQGDIEKDWADDGLNRGRTPRTPDERCPRAQVLDPRHTWSVPELASLDH